MESINEKIISDVAQTESGDKEILKKRLEQLLLVEDELTQTVSVEGGFSKEKKEQMERFARERLGVNLNCYINAARYFFSKERDRIYKGMEKNRREFIHKIYEYLLARVPDPAASVVERMKGLTKYHSEFISSEDSEVVDLWLANSFSPTMGLNGVVVYRGNGVDFKYVLHNKVADYLDESKVNDLQPRWVTPQLGVALDYAHDDTGVGAQVRVYELTDDIYRYNFSNRNEEGSLGGDKVEDHKSYTDEEAAKLKLEKMTNLQLAENLLNLYVGNSMKELSGIEPKEKESGIIKDTGERVSFIESEYVLRNKDLKNNLVSVYTEITEGKHKGKWRRIYQRPGSNNEHLPLKQYFSHDDLNQISLKTVANLIAKGNDFGFLQLVKNNPAVLAQALKMIETSGVDVKKIRREYESRFNPSVEDKKIRLIEKAINDFVLTLAVDNILDRQKGISRTEEQEKDLRSEVLLKKVKNVFDPLHFISKYQDGLHQKNRESVSQRLSKKREEIKLTTDEVGVLYQDILKRLEVEFTLPH